MKKSILNLGKALNKAKQKEINGGNSPTPRNSCKYYCNGRNKTLEPGQGMECYLNFPYVIFNHKDCGGSGETGEGWV